MPADSTPTILLPLDLSTAGETKVPVAIDYAQLLGARIVVLHVLPRRELRAGTISPGEALARTYLDAIGAQIEAAGVPAASIVRGGEPATVILAEAALLKARMIVLSSSARPLLATMVRASIGDQVARRAECPVVLVRPASTSSPRHDSPRSFVADAARAGGLTRHHRGVRSIEVARIVGSVDRAEEVGPNFRRRGPHKVSSGDEQRFQRILTAAKNEEYLPPINVYKLGFGYYVEDGHHRVAAALATGQTEIDADVTEFLPVADESAELASSARTQFERSTGLTDVTAARARTYAALGQAIEAYAQEEGLPELPLAARRWERCVFRPLWLQVRERELAEPGELSADAVARLLAST